MGFGLDERAVTAIERWRFKPGTREGKPVKIWATVEVNFRLCGQWFDRKAEERRTAFNLAAVAISKSSDRRPERALNDLQNLVKKKHPPAMHLLGYATSRGALV